MKLPRLSGIGALLAILVASASCGKKEQTKDEPTPPVEGKEAAKAVEDEGTPPEPSSSAEAMPAPTEPMPAPTATVKVSDKDELDVWVFGEGAPVVLVHGAFFWDLLRPLAHELSKTGNYQVVMYHRRGYHGKPTGPVTIPEQAKDLVKILDELEISKAHVVAHSYGAMVSLETMTQAPDRFLSAALFEPVLATQIKTKPKMPEGVMPKVKSGDFEGASATFLATLGGSKEVMEEAVPGSWAAMVETSAKTWFTVEMPAMAKWKLDPAKVKALKVPLALMVADEGPLYQESRELLQKWLPDLKLVDIPGASDHFFPIKAFEETAAASDEWIQGQEG